MDHSMKLAMDRSADPRIYASAAKQSMQPSKYCMSDVKYPHSVKIESLPLSSIEKPAVSVPRFNKNDLSYCSWIPS